MGWLDDAKKSNIISIKRINPDELFSCFNETDKFMAKKFETNKSLSARVKRRNAQGFVGAGSHVMFKKDNIGDYRDVSQNHKDTDTIEHKSLVRHYGRMNTGKHPGSKPMRNLYNA